MFFKKGTGWKACYDTDSGRFFGEHGGMQAYYLFEITKEIFDRLDVKMTESTAGSIIHEGRRMYMAVDDRCGPPYTIVFDDDYEKMCPWADVVKSGNVWPAELTAAVFELFEPEKNSHEQQRKKREYKG